MPSHLHRARWRTVTSAATARSVPWGLALTLLAAFARTAAAQPLTGRIVDVDSREPVIGAFVEIESPGSTSQASLTDETGAFSIDQATAPFTIRITAVGYRSFEARYENVQPLAISLSLDIDNGEVIVVQSESAPFESPTSYGFSSEEVRSLPGSGNDVLKSVQSLPGVARVPFGGGGLVLRGTSPRDSSVYLDDIEVPILYHFGNLASFYPSAMLDSLELAPGGFGVAYGRALGGLVTLQSKAGRKDQWRVAGEMSLLDASVRADGPSSDKSSWSLGVRRSYIDAILGAALPDDSPLSLTVAPRYYDAQARYDYTPTDRDVISVLLFGSDDKMRLSLSPEPSFDPGVDGFRFDTNFWRLGASWTRIAGDTTIKVTPWLGYDRSELRVGDQGVDRRDIPAGLRASATYEFSGGYSKTGLDAQGRQNRLRLDNRPPPMPGVGMQEDAGKVTRDVFADVALFQELSLSFGRRDWLTVKPGLRVERFGLSREWVVDPRLSLRQAVTKDVALKQAVGLYHQPPATADKDWGNPDLRASVATQAEVGAEANIGGAVDLSATAFGLQSDRLSVDVVSSASAVSAGGSTQSGGAGAASAQFLEEQFGTWSYRDSVGKGRSFGIELLARVQTEGFLGFVAYTVSRSERTGDARADDTYYRYVLDQPHVLTALASQKLGSWQFGGRLRYATGNPYTPVADRYFDSDAQEYQPVDGPILSQRLPAFFQLDVRVDRRWQLGVGRLSAFLDVQNLTNRVNPEGVSYNYDYSRINYTRGLPFVPFLGVELVQ